MDLSKQDLQSIYPVETLDVLSFFALLAAIFVIVSKNPVHSVLFLILLFLIISIYLIILGMYFIGLSYLLVYVGAVSILFLFILMLINIRISEITNDSSNSIPLALLFSVFLITCLNFRSPYYLGLPSGISDNTRHYYPWQTNLKDIHHVSYYLWDKNLFESSHITSLGNILYSNYPLWIILISKILLLAMVGTIVITLKPKT